MNDLKFLHLNKSTVQIDKEKDAHGSMQLKGTELCLDIYCACGQHSHVDGMFVFFVQCPKCEVVYELNPTVALTCRGIEDVDADFLKIGEAEEIINPENYGPDKETFSTSVDKYVSESKILESRFGEERVGHLNYALMPPNLQINELHEMGHYLGMPRPPELLPEPDGSLLFSWVNIKENCKTFTSKFTPPYRVGRKQKRAILDSKGHQVIVFPKGSEAEAQAFCVFLNIIA